MMRRFNLWFNNYKISELNCFLLSLARKYYLSNEEIWDYYILLFDDLGRVGTMEYCEYAACGEECDYV